MNQSKAVLTLSGVVLLITGAVLYAGPLTPPVGPVTSTYKTLSEVEPRIAINSTNTPGDNDSLFKIAQPGSYYLTGNITGVVGKHGIKIFITNGVTIDLNGFELLGVVGSLDGVFSTSGGMRNITIRNGSIRNWGEDGLDLSNGNTNVALVEGVLSSGNGNSGIRMGTGGLVVNCNASYNGASGISSALTAIGCVARDNGQHGITSVNGGTVTGCTAINNTANGILALDGCTVSGCTSRANGSGIVAFERSLIKDCTASANTVDGINVLEGTTIIDCVASENGADGIVVLHRSLVRGNTIANNVNRGIFVSASGYCRIEGNDIAGNDRGLYVLGAGNVILRNTSSGNTTTNWQIAANNVFGPIIDRTAPVSAAINGNAAPSSLGSTDPNANYSY